MCLQYIVYVTLVRGICNSGNVLEDWVRGYKTFSMPNSVEHEILNVHKYKNIMKFSFF